jgi:ABC-type phosphate transport system substrate-binding protein
LLTDNLLTDNAKETTMRADRFRGKRGAAALAATAILGLFAFGPSQAAQATTYAEISGSGSSYAAGALQQWATDLVPQGLQINYDPVGSATGREQYIQGENDFAGSDIAFISPSDPDPFAGSDGTIDFAYSYIPDVAGGLAFMYNLQVDGQKITNLRLRPQTLAEIFTGHITNWDNPTITHDYGAQLPNLPITVVTRSDGAGESYFLSRWMWKMYPSLWEGFCHAQGGPSNCGPTELYPGQSAGFKALDGAEDVAGYIASPTNNGAIGYAETYYALNYHIPIVSVANPAGYYVQPTGSNVAIALEKAQIDENQNDVTFLMQNLDNVYTDTDPRAYPLSAYSYLIVPRNKRTIGGTTYTPRSGTTTATGVSLSTYINFILCGAQASAVSLGYSPLPGPMVTGGFLQDGDIPGAVPSPAAHNYATCNNPAFYDGKDVLTATAPYPLACQKVTAPLNASCTGSESKTGDSGSTTGSKNSGSGRNSHSDNGTDPNTGQPTTGTSPGTAVSAEPVGLAGQPEAQWLFGTLAAVVLLAAISMPVLLGSWLQRRKATAAPGGTAAPSPGGGTPGRGR